MISVYYFLHLVPISPPPHDIVVEKGLLPLGLQSS